MKEEIRLLKEIRDILYELSMDWHAEKGINRRAK